jgi:hypothetical protein
VSFAPLERSHGVSMSACRRHHCMNFTRFACLPKISYGHNFCIQGPFEVSFAPLESSCRDLQLGVVFVEF